MKWLSRLFGKRVFTPLEQLLLDSLRRSLSPKASKLLGEQLRSINLVQRHSQGREICLYSLRRGRPQHIESKRFPDSNRPLKVATVAFEISGEGKFRGEFFVVRGYLFSIEFTPSIARVSERADAVIHDMIVHRDPTIPTRAPNWPLSQADKQLLLSEIEASLPSDYIEAVITQGGFRDRSVDVLGLDDVDSVVLENATYYVLARVGDSGVLAVRKHSQDGDVHFVTFDGAARSLGRSLRKAIDIVATHHDLR